MAGGTSSNTRLREAREALGITLAELGRRIGKTKQYLSELERGHIRLTYDMAVKIAGALGTTPDGIFLPVESKSLVHDGHSRPPHAAGAAGEEGAA